MSHIEKKALLVQVTWKTMPHSNSSMLCEGKPGMLTMLVTLTKWYF